MRITCCCCNRQLVKGCIAPTDRITTFIGAKAGVRADSPFCGECARDLDENGLFPEERDAEYLRDKEIYNESC